MKIYLFSPENGEFIREDDAVESPAEPGVYLIPAFATDIAPPPVGEGEVAGFAGGKWTIRKVNPALSRTPDQARKEKLFEIKNKAAKLLSDGDYLVQRQMEQIAMGLTPSLSDEDYAALLQKRQGIRDASNAYEAKLGNIPDVVTMIDALKINY